MTPPPDKPDERVRAERVRTERVRAERALCGLVNGLAQRIGDHLRQHAAGLGLTAAQAGALRELDGPLTMRELAGRMSCEPSNATFVVDRLERQGLVERRPHPTDRRARQLVLTPAGTGLRERLLALLAADSPLAGLGPEQRLALQELLEQALARP
ncbi:MarR family winged helix-turn-helix transcriptional regulator [Kitasatospora purpeofusca]|uniref:MarR family winged helix-turn-helix transcriptional regulator n=1 Tax=Kitasatospora purpeofusca TaxID=67352 RepID=UPI002A5A9AEC|nr:MarR family transcriptional regulator [Kitasatospora purpeofusca]MDY0814683.1 MarR family transcriptional regulator [Kitasatospora purpeofusca]